MYSVMVPHHYAAEVNYYHKRRCRVVEGKGQGVTPAVVSDSWCGHAPPRHPSFIVLLVFSLFPVNEVRDKTHIWGWHAHAVQQAVFVYKGKGVD